MELCPLRFWRQSVSQRFGAATGKRELTGIIIYLVSIPLGIRKAVRNGNAFDIWSSTFIIIGCSIPAFLFGIMLIVLFSLAAVISTGSRCVA